MDPVHVAILLFAGQGLGQGPAPAGEATRDLVARLFSSRLEELDCLPTSQILVQTAAVLSTDACLSISSVYEGQLVALAGVLESSIASTAVAACIGHSQGLAAALVGSLSVGQGGCRTLEAAGTLIGRLMLHLAVTMQQHTAELECRADAFESRPRMALFVRSTDAPVAAFKASLPLQCCWAVVNSDKSRVLCGPSDRVSAAAADAGPVAKLLPISAVFHHVSATAVPGRVLATLDARGIPHLRLLPRRLPVPVFGGSPATWSTQELCRSLLQAFAVEPVDWPAACSHLAASVGPGSTTPITLVDCGPKGLRSLTASLLIAAGLNIAPADPAPAPVGQDPGNLLPLVSSILVATCGLSHAPPTHQPLGETGGLASHHAAAFAAALGKATGLRLPATIAFDYPTLASLASRCAALMRGEGDDDDDNDNVPSRAVVTSTPGDRPVLGISSATVREPAGPGMDAIGPVPLDRWDADQPRQETPFAPRFSGFLAGLEAIDAAVHGLRSSEAAAMDPQHRLLLDCALALAPLPASSAVYAAVSWADHHAALTALHLSERPAAVTAATGSALIAAANVVSAAMSTMLRARRMLAPDGRCKTADASADGYARAEAGCAVMIESPPAAGAGVLLLAATAANQDGASSSLTAPSGRAQSSLLREAVTSAGITPASVSSLALHGTGTALGDPIEVAAAASALLAPGRGGASRAAEPPLSAAAHKSRVGHSESAAGLCALCALACRLQAHTGATAVHLRSLNPLLGEVVTAPFARACSLGRQTAPWPLAASDRPNHGAIIAGVSAFAYQGSNAHALVAWRGGAGGGASPGPNAPGAAIVAATHSPRWRWLLPPLHPGVTATGPVAPGAAACDVAWCRDTFPPASLLAAVSAVHRTLVMVGDADSDYAGRHDTGHAAVIARVSFMATSYGPDASQMMRVTVGAGGEIDVQMAGKTVLVATLVPLVRVIVVARGTVMASVMVSVTAWTEGNIRWGRLEGFGRPGVAPSQGNRDGDAVSSCLTLLQPSGQETVVSLAAAHLGLTCHHGGAQRPAGMTAAAAGDGAWAACGDRTAAALVGVAFAPVAQAVDRRPPAAGAARPKLLVSVRTGAAAAIAWAQGLVSRPRNS